MENLDSFDYEKIKKQFIDTTHDHIFKRENLSNVLSMEDFGEFDMYDMIDEEFQKEIEAIEVSLEEHKSFMDAVSDYNKYTANIILQVEEKTAYVEALYRKRFRSKSSSAFFDIMDADKDFNEIPLLIQEDTDHHNEIMDDIDKQNQMIKSQMHECYLNEKQLLADINSLAEQYQNVIQQSNETDQRHEQCKHNALKVENIQKVIIPQVHKEVLTSAEELKAVKDNLIAESENTSTLEKEMREFEEESDELQKEKFSYEDQLVVIDENLENLLTKNSMSEIEAEERFKEFCKSEFFTKEKQNIVQLHVDKLAISSDLQNFEGHIESLNSEIEDIYKKVQENKFGEIADKLNEEYEKLAEIEKKLQEKIAQLNELIKAENSRKDKILADKQQEFDNIQKQLEEMTQNLEKDLEHYNSLVEKMNKEIEKNRMTARKGKEQEPKLADIDPSKKRKSAENTTENETKKQKITSDDNEQSATQISAESSTEDEAKKQQIITSVDIDPKEKQKSAENKTDDEAKNQKTKSPGNEQSKKRKSAENIAEDEANNQKTKSPDNEQNKKRKSALKNTAEDEAKKQKINSVDVGPKKKLESEESTTEIEAKKPKAGKGKKKVRFAEIESPKKVRVKVKTPYRFCRTQPKDPRLVMTRPLTPPTPPPKSKIPVRTETKSPDNEIEFEGLTQKVSVTLFDTSSESEEDNQSKASQATYTKKLNDSLESELEGSTSGVKATKGMNDIQFISMFRSDDEESFASNFDVPKNLMMNTSTETEFGL